jgi:alanyl-tRNA synthetase
LDKIEIWNNVLMEYNKNKKGIYEEAIQKNIDTGMGVERTTTLLSGLTDNYKADMWKPIIQEIEHLSGKEYSKNKKEMRIIADHIKAAIFILNSGISPSNTEQGYVLRRLIRRAIMNLRKLDFIGTDLIWPIAEPIFKIYPEYNLDKNLIYKEIKKEEEKFEKTLEKGLKIFEKMSKDKKIDGKEAFLLFQSYGFPIEITTELSKEKGIKINTKEFEKELSKHQKLSRTATAGKFKSGLADHKEATTKLHTAAHLLMKSLKIVLKKEDLIQKGSNINSERLRLDFSFDRKLTKEEITKIENTINEKIKEAIPVIREEMTLKQAKKQGASGIFEDKYGEKVSVYTIGNFSKEICTGPHVKNTKEIGKFKIIKEQSSSSGVRRIRAIIE